MPRKEKKDRSRPFIRKGPFNRPPPGLKGREIGLYYRNLQMNKPKPEENMINLRIPNSVILEIYKYLEKIENIAKEHNIYLPPVQKLNFIDSNNVDFIPIITPASERIEHTVSNIHKIDNDVVFIKNEEPEVIEILDNDDISEDTKNGIFVSNNYVSIPSTSSNTINRTNSEKEYKYGYEDIITGTFQEKLDECIAQGIEIEKTGQDIDKLYETLNERKHKLPSNDQYEQVMNFRKTLPTYKKASTVLDVINKNQVVVISGETGCGKSTQVPQLILDDAIEKNKGANVKVLVTEPRRIAASSLAVRVAEERGEGLGHTVGYAVRLEAVPCRDRGSIMFVTTGVLLVELEQNQALSGYSHIILDEVHERDCQIDMAMFMLKQVLQKRKDLKLILMSATIDAESLSSYYGDCPMIHIEGLAYPVQDVYMEEILQWTRFKLPHKDIVELPPWKKHVARHKAAVNEAEKAMQYRAMIDPWIRTVKRKYPSDVINQLQDSRIEDINFDLIIRLMEHICRGAPGAILVFLPGITDITKLMGLMSKKNTFPPSTYDIHVLHSKLPSIDQKQIFRRPPKSVRKIIIATNIAETSITIDDVVYVIDCGKIKYKGLDVEKNIATLQTEWISKANLRQRRGRAGRCQPGICYHLITTHRAEILEDRLAPELQRTNLLEEVLCIKRLRLGKAEDALSKMPAVPAEKTVQTAIKHLQQIGALDENETLTPLGWHLARLPVHPAAGKLLLLGALFGCLARAASVAAVWGFKDPFHMVMNKTAEVDRAKRDFALGEPSDHVAMSEAIIQWEQCSYQEKRNFAYTNFLSMNNLELLSSMKKQFADNLQQMGFLTKPDINSSWENRNTDNLSLFKAIVAAALYPNIAHVRWSNLKSLKLNRPIRITAKTPEDGKVSIHPSSVMANKSRRDFTPVCTNPGANWLVYWLKHKSAELYLLDVTCVYTLPLLFFGDLRFNKADKLDECLISISSAKVCCKKETAQLLFELRSLLDKVLSSKISRRAGEHSKPNFEFEQEVLRAVTDLITAEDEGTQYLGWDDDDDDDRDSVCSEQSGGSGWRR